MNEKPVRQAPSSTELLQQVKEQMSMMSPWPERFNRLAEAITEVEAVKENEGVVTCQQCQESLDLLVVDEREGFDVRQRYPEVLAHLAECNDCRTTYTLLQAALSSDEEQLEATSLSSVAPISSRSVDEFPVWPRQGALSSQPFPVTLRVVRDLISKALCGPQLAFVRGQTAEEGEHTALLLADVVTTEQGDLVIEVTTHWCIERPQVIDLEVQLTTDCALPESLKATMYWGSIRRSQPVDAEGEARFQDLPLSQVIEPSSDLINDDLVLVLGSV
jgi:hypothetical protein